MDVPDFLIGLTQSPQFRNAVVSAVVVVILLVVRRIALRAVIKPETPPEVSRRLQVGSRNGLLLAVVLIFVFLWAQEIRSLAISAFAVAAAIVLATKELIMCISGGIYRTVSRPFAVGDRIEVGAFRGGVIDATTLSTRLAEIGPGQTTHQHTGRMVVVPNSLFLSQTVVNETYTEQYVLHVFTVPIAATDDWQAAERKLLDAAASECAPFIEEARRHFEGLQGRHALDTIQIDPRISVRKPEPGRVDLIVRVPVPARRKGRVEQAILRRFLTSTDVGE
jgi:small-conductance mechanosensitive channel